MKQSINLILRQEDHDEYQWIKIFVFPAGALFALILLAGATVIKAKEVSALRLEVQEMGQKREKLNQRISDLARRYPARDRNPRMESLSLTGKGLEWSKMLREISRQLPPSVWLTRIESSSLKEKGAENERIEKEMKISGIAREHRDVEQLLFALEKPSAWKDIRLIFSKKAGERDKEKIKFQITFRLN